MQTTATARRTAPLALPADISAHLARFSLTLADLLTDSNPKMAKGADLAAAVILHHLPARSLAAALTPGRSGPTAPRSYLPALAALAAREGVADLGRRWQGCPWATAGCAAGCLAWAGHGGISAAVATARGRRTLAMIADPVTYARAVLWATARAWARAQTAGQALAVRLRGTDEGPAIGWHRLWVPITPADAAALGHRYGLPVVPGDQLTLAQALAVPRAEGSLHLYDYSKAPVSGPLGLAAQRAAGWDVTASMAADRATATADVAAAIRAGFRLAVPIALGRGQALPVALELTPAGGSPVTVPVVPGDLTDHRWADPHGVAVALTVKVSRGADRSVADRFSLPATDHPQRLPDGAARLIW